MEREAIEAQAQRTLDAVPSWLWDGATLPVPVERIADSHFGLLVREVGDLAAAPGAPALHPGQTFSGLLLPDAGEIWINAAEAREWPARRRFTIGHELGHWCMHRAGAGTGAVYCRAASVAEAAGAAPEDAAPAAPQTLPRPPRPPREDEANLFGAALLMPARLLGERYALDRDFERLRELFDVSGGALGRRLHAVI